MVARLANALEVDLRLGNHSRELPQFGGGTETCDRQDPGIRGEFGIGPHWDGQPCRRALRADCNLPAADLGPVLARAFARLARSLRRLVMVTPRLARRAAR